MIEVKGKTIDDQTKYKHNHSPLDVMNNALCLWLLGR